MNNKTPRWSSDYYPTPRAVGVAIGRWLLARGDSFDAFLDPAAGSGHLIEGMRDVFGESHWHAIEIDRQHERDLELCSEVHEIGDALTSVWPAVPVVANPPFNQLDAFWSRISEHRRRHAVWCAALTPVAWWNAEKRREATRPDFIVSLGWRPTFHPKNGPAHKGSQDFLWAVLAPHAQPTCQWERVEKSIITTEWMRAG